jgi:hypothetical protein
VKIKICALIKNKEQKNQLESFKLFELPVYQYWSRIVATIIK